MTQIEGGGGGGGGFTEVERKKRCSEIKKG